MRERQLVMQTAMGMGGAMGGRTLGQLWNRGVTAAAKENRPG